MGWAGGGRWRVRRVAVTGDSMRPALVPGDHLVVLGWPGQALRPGDVVAARDPRQPARVVVKRVGRPPAPLAPGELWLVGDHPAASTDSRTFGPVLRTTVLGRCVYRYAPAERAGRLGREPGR